MKMYDKQLLKSNKNIRIKIKNKIKQTLSRQPEAQNRLLRDVVSGEGLVYLELAGQRLIKSKV
jgi:hypothetical protein